MDCTDLVVLPRTHILKALIISQFFLVNFSAYSDFFSKTAFRAAIIKPVNVAKYDETSMSIQSGFTLQVGFYISTCLIQHRPLKFLKMEVSLLFKHLILFMLSSYYQQLGSYLASFNYWDKMMDQIQFKTYNLKCAYELSSQKESEGPKIKPSRDQRLRLCILSSIFFFFLICQLRSYCSIRIFIVAY